MGTFNNSIQDKIEKLQKTVDTLLHMGENMDCICVDDLSLLNNEIHEQINDLYLYHGETTEQEAALCLSLLMGYSVSMYANPEDELKKQTVLLRTGKILPLLPPSPLKEHLLSAYNELQHSFSIN